MAQTNLTKSDWQTLERNTNNSITKQTMHMPKQIEEISNKYCGKHHGVVDLAENRCKAYTSDYVLLKNIDWFGTIIEAGTIYKSHGNDYWWPVIDTAHCPSLQVDFRTVLNSPEYFLEIKK